MAELLKNKYPLAVAEKNGEMILEVHPSFDSKGFVNHVEQGYDQLELMERSRKIAIALKVYLPNEFEKAVTILLASLDSHID